MTTPLATLSACSQRPYPRKYSMLYSSMTTPLPTLGACSQRPYPRKYSILYSSTYPPQMAYIYLLSFPHRWRYRPFPFSLPLHSLTYITRQQTSMAASSVATRPGMHAVQPSFWGEAFPKIHTAGAHPSLSQPMGICRSPTLGKQ